MSERKVIDATNGKAAPHIEFNTGTHTVTAEEAATQAVTIDGDAVVTVESRAKANAWGGKTHALKGSLVWVMMSTATVYVYPGAKVKDVTKGKATLINVDEDGNPVEPSK